MWAERRLQHKASIVDVSASFALSVYLVVDAARAGTKTEPTNVEIQYALQGVPHVPYITYGRIKTLSVFHAALYSAYFLRRTYKPSNIFSIALSVHCVAEEQHVVQHKSSCTCSSLVLNAQVLEPCFRGHERK